MKDGERGSVLILGVGLLGIVLLALAVTVDASALLMQRQRVLALADGAALAGAQGIDLDAYYRTGASRGTRLEPGQVTSRVRAYVMRSSAGEATVDAIDTDGVTVRVEVSAPISLPFLGSGVLGRIRVRSAARLDSAAE